MVAQTNESHGKMHSLQTSHFLLLYAKNGMNIEEIHQYFGYVLNYQFKNFV
jgi:hypothetical protein